MVCSHKGFHAIRSRYDHRRELLIFFWTCEVCGEKLGEARREQYKPQFDPRGNERFVSATH